MTFPIIIPPVYRLGAFATIDPTKTTSFITLSGGNLTGTANSGANNGCAHLTVTVTYRDKFYVEFLINQVSGGSPTEPVIGIRQSTSSLINGSLPGDAASGTGSVGYASNGNKYLNGSQIAYGNTFAAADTIGVAIDGVNGACYFRKGATWQNSGDPTSGATKTGAANTWTPSSSINFDIAVGLFILTTTASVTLNAGASTFTQTIPSGYSPTRA